MRGAESGIATWQPEPYLTGRVMAPCDAKPDTTKIVSPGNPDCYSDVGTKDSRGNVLFIP